MELLVEKLKHMVKPITILLFLLPITAAVGLGAVLEKQQNDLVIPVAIVDEDQTDFSRSIVKQMDSQPRIVVKETSIDEAHVLLSRNEVDSIFVFKAGFQKRLMNEKRKETIELWTSPTSVASGIVREVVASEVTKVTSSIKAANRIEKLYQQKGVDHVDIWEEAYEYNNAQWNPEPLMTIHYVNETSKAGTEHQDPLFTSYLGVWSFITMFSCFITSDWVVKERSTLFPRMKTTHKGLATYLLQTSGAYLLYHSLQALCSFWLLGSLHLIDRNICLYLGMIIYIIFTTALGMWMASRIHHLGSYYVTGFLLSFILAIFGGSFFPIAELSPSLQILSRWLPQNILWLTAYPEYSSSSEIGMTVLFMVVCIWLIWRAMDWGLKVR